MAHISNDFVKQLKAETEDIEFGQIVITVQNGKPTYIEVNKKVKIS